MFYLTEYLTLKMFNIFSLASYISVRNREIGYDIPICGIFKLHGEAMRLRPNFVWVMKVDKNVGVTVFILRN